MPRSGQLLLDTIPLVRKIQRLDRRTKKVLEELGKAHRDVQSIGSESASGSSSGSRRSARLKRLRDLREENAELITDLKATLETSFILHVAANNFSNRLERLLNATQEAQWEVDLTGVGEREGQRSRED
jgi:Rad3-related DNA helicase